MPAPCPERWLPCENHVSDTPPHALLRPRIALPFVLVALIWGSTWFVIKGQLDLAPPAWSVAYRFAVAGAAMFAIALVMRQRLCLSAREQGLAMALGLTQFVFNFNLVYRAEVHLTSGIVAVLFALLMLPNAVLGRLLLGAQVTPRFLLGTGIALVGIILLLVHESQGAAVDGNVALGVGLTLLAILSASSANVMQALPLARATPITTLLAWAMAWGTLGDVAWAWASSGPPVWPASGGYWAGIAYLGLIGSAVAFPLYFGLIRDLGPGRAAYNGVLVPVVAMALSTLFEGYRWGWLAAGGAAIALAGLVVALRGRQVG